MMVEKIQRFIGGNAREPKRELREFDGKWVHVHAVDASFDNAASPIGDLGLLLGKAAWDGYPAVLQYLFTRAAVLAQRNNLLGHQPRGGVINNLLGKPFRCAHQKMA